MSHNRLGMADDRSTSGKPVDTGFHSRTLGESLYACHRGLGRGGD